MLSEHIKSIKRARFFYLYDLHGKRYLDFFQGSGSLFLGERPLGLSKLVKNTFSRGLIGPYPNIYRDRLSKSFFKLFPLANKTYVFANEERALNFLSLKYESFEVYRPWQTKASNGIYKWHPAFLNYSYPMLINNFFPSSLQLTYLSFKEGEREFILEKEFDAFSLSISLHYFNLLYKSYKEPIKFSLSIFENLLWKRVGRALLPLYKRDKHFKVFKTFLDEGYLLNDNYNEPSLIPLVFSKGDFAKFKKISLILKQDLALEDLT